MASTPGFEPEPHWWEASALAPAPSLAPQRDDERFPPPPPKGKDKPLATQANVAVKFQSTTCHSTTGVPQVDVIMKTQATCSNASNGSLPRKYAHFKHSL